MTEINKNNKKKSIPALIGSELLLNIKTKWIGFFIGLIAMALTIVAMVYYRDILPELYHGGVIVAGIVGCALFVVLSLSRPTSQLAPIALMACDILCLGFYARGEGIIDYFSTQFFSGFSFETLFSLPQSVWLSAICIVAAFVVSSIAVYVPQNRKTRAEKMAERRAQRAKKAAKKAARA